jgi:hypothetical protein
MFRVGSWLYGKKPAANASTQSLDSLVELRDRECSFCLRYAALTDH